MIRLLTHFKTNYEDINLNEIGIELYTGREYNAYTPHKEFVLHLVTKGKGTFKANNQEFHLKENCGFILKKGVHATYYSDNNDFLEYYWVSISGNMLNTLLRHTQLFKTNYIVFNKFSNSKTIIKNLCEETERFLKEGQDLITNQELFLWYQKETYSLLYSLINEFPLTLSNSSELKNSYELIAKNYINQNFQKDIKIADLSDYIGVDRTYLYRLFKRRYGISPQEYLIRLRLEKSCEYLWTTNLMIKEIVNLVGFSDTFNFTKKFTEFYNISPSEYRKRRRV